MKKKVKVNNIYEVIWPHVCAKCCDTQHLINADSLENKITKKIRKIDPQLEYFICEKHAKWLALANLSVDSCDTMVLVRLISHFATTLFSIFVITLPLQLIHNKFSDLSVPYILIPFAVYILFCRFLAREIPIRKTKFSSKEYILEFDNADYAERFILENQKHTIVERLN